MINITDYRMHFGYNKITKNKEVLCMRLKEKSLCPRFDSWWHHEESQQKDENL